MGKKRTLAIILLLCVLGWEIACGRKEKEDEYYFHLLEKDKKTYGDGKPYDKQYMNATDSETYLVEFLKNLQKNA